ncbi:SDR family oxidoreductase [Umezawaea sp.]|uniref:SDR family oxidoreductase n=1 Tax=Umezawaea sp. TaxID=1955258 RepID=UPI002ED1E217
MIIVSGANGTLGGLVVQRLLDRVAPERVGVCVRDPERARGLAERGVRVRRGDFADAASLDHAFEGASRVLVVSVDSAGEEALRLHGTAIDAAARSGARRVVYTSHTGSNPDSPFPPMPDHAATEVLLRDSGVDFTVLRNGFYASSALVLLGAALETGELALPEDGPVSWTAHADLAEAAVVALVDDVLDGVSPDLTGAEAVDMAGVAAIASELTGRPVRRVVVPDEDYRAGLLARGVPGRAADLLVGLFEASRKGEFARVDPALPRLLGRPPAPLRDVLRAAIG